MMNLANKIKPYEEAVKLNAHGIFHKLDKERAEIVQLLSPLMAKKDINDPFLVTMLKSNSFIQNKKKMKVRNSRCSNTRLILW